ncbi:MAG TPA: PH domain-containing protein [Blastocatellia bacterium]|nr:PH domain-containing protein [Blastocatellia bacterium]
MSGTKAVAGDRVGANQIKPVLIDHPDLRLIKLGYLVPLALVAAGVVILLLSVSDAAKIGIGYALIMALGSMLTFLLSSHARLRKASYTVTADYIEAQTGTFEKTSRRIPLSYIRDVTHRQHFFQTLFDVSDIKVTATNGDSVVFENVSNGLHKREIIWELVIARSPGASR